VVPRDPGPGRDGAVLGVLALHALGQGGRGVGEVVELADLLFEPVQGQHPVDPPARGRPRLARDADQDPADRGEPPQPRVLEVGFRGDAAFPVGPVDQQGHPTVVVEVPGEASQDRGLGQIGVLAGGPVELVELQLPALRQQEALPGAMAGRSQVGPVAAPGRVQPPRLPGPDLADLGPQAGPLPLLHVPGLQLHHPGQGAGDGQGRGDPAVHGDPAQGVGGDHGEVHPLVPGHGEGDVVQRDLDVAFRGPADGEHDLAPGIGGGADGGEPADDILQGPGIGPLDAGSCYLPSTCRSGGTDPGAPDPEGGLAAGRGGAGAV